MQALSRRRSQDRDFQFLNQITSSNVCSEWNGYNTFLNRTEGHTIRPKTTSVCTPLIDMKPTDPDTMLTAMIQAKKLTTGAGQSVVLLTCDQHLYKIAVNITWAYPGRFTNFILRFGRMHFLMNFIGCIGILMADTR